MRMGLHGGAVLGLPQNSDNHFGLSGRLGLACSPRSYRNVH